MLSDLLSAERVAELLDLDCQAILRLARRQGSPLNSAKVKVGRRVYFIRSRLEQELRRMVDN
ncbi:hypothetical protein D6779_02475 [Candidatus Parcubacteria bacterium]|nr:MAG: hypothetical protein D6779_02475 [Candidatus Parcubacteria bacterium]